MINIQERGLRGKEKSQSPIHQFTYRYDFWERYGGIAYFSDGRLNLRKKY